MSGTQVFIDGLPAASAVSASDLLIVGQGGTGTAGTATPRQATVAQVLAAIASGLPTALPTQSGVLWNNGGVLCIS